MKITKTKIKREMVKNYEWGEWIKRGTGREELLDAFIKDALKVVDKILVEQKGISIK